MPDSNKRTEVRAERVDTKCGSVGHMTADEIKRRSIGENVNVTCPECGEIHLTEEDASEAEKKKISETPRYKQIKSEAEEED
ncbi:MAG: hypothetical protein ACOZHQ_18655 [Thermodesulfobacteriota bacterium]